MEIADYTPANILNALGLSAGAPVAPVGGWSALILLKPSFDPEVCLSIVTDRTGRARAEIRALSANLWMTSRTGEATEVFVSSIELEPASAAAVRELIDRPHPPREVLALDGMSFVVLFRDAARTAEHAAHLSADSGIATLLRELLPILLVGVRDQNCRSALRRVTRYVPSDAELKRPEFEVPHYVASVDITTEGWSPKQPKTFIVLLEALGCPHCSRSANRFRKLADNRLICLACARSFAVDPDVLVDGREEGEAAEDVAG